MIPAEPDKFAFVIPDKLKFKTLPDIDVPTPEPVTIKSPPKGIEEVDDDEGDAQPEAPVILLSLWSCCG